MFSFLKRIRKAIKKLLFNHTLETKAINKISENDNYTISVANNLKIQIENAKEFIREKAFPVKPTNFVLKNDDGTVSQDSLTNLKSTLFPFNFNENDLGANPLLMEWYVRQGFIGYQNCAIIAQHWLVDRCCTLPAKDAVRNGYFITQNGGEELEAEVSQAITNWDEEFGINNQLIQFYKKSAIFGIRIAIFKVKSKDKKYYEKPFNIDGITPGSYEGIVQVDPYWITPELDMEAAGDPAAIDFYEPTYWRVNGNLYHKSHLIITRYSEVADILKPTYIYGGIPLTQMLYEAVYNYERTSNEAPILVQSKRLYVGYIDGLEQLLANPKAFQDRINCLVNEKNNYGFYFLDKEDKVEKFDTSLGDVNETINTAAQRVAAISTIVETVLFSKQIGGGLNNRGDGDYRNYTDVVIDVQRRIQPLLKRHHEILMKSHIEPKFGPQPPIEAVWNNVESPDVDKEADSKLKEADRDLKYMEMGVLSPDEIRNKVAKDKKSGYEIEVTEESEPINNQTNQYFNELKESSNIYNESELDK